MAIFQAAVEGDLDEAVLRRIVDHCGAELGVVYGREGKPRLRQNIRGYNHAAKWQPWIVVVDLDDEEPCAGELRSKWLPDQTDLMCFRVAVREVEAWLMADRAGFSSFLAISASLVPPAPDEIDDPKQTLVNLATRSRRRAIRDALPPAEGSRRTVGVLYNPMLRSFVAERWDPIAAASRSDSLQRCVGAIEAMLNRAPR